MFKRSLIMALLVTLVTSGLVSAANWYGDVSDSFTTAANWSDYASPNGDLYIRALPIGGASNDCNLTTPYNNGGTTYVVNGGVFQERATTYFTPSGTACFQSGSLYVSAGTMNVYPAVPVTNNSVRVAGNLYVGCSVGNTGTMNIMTDARVTVKSGSTFTLGGSSSGSGAIGRLNLHGHIDCTNLRLNWNGFGGYTINLYQGADFWTGGDSSAALNAGITSGNIVSMVTGQVPVVDFNSVNNNTWLRLARQYKASVPTPANNATIQNMTGTQSLTLSWVKPLPEDPNKPVTSDVYISNDPNMVIGVTHLAAGFSGDAISHTVNKLTTYYWRVDSTDPNKAVPLTTGDRWTFNTNNTAPAITIASPYMTAPNGNVVLWLPNNTSTTVASTIVDDGYPLGGTTSYLWQRQNLDTVADANWYDISTTSSAPTPVYTTVGGTVSDNYNYRLTYSDGELNTVRNFQVRVFVNTCIASPRMPGHTALTGEMTGDCRVNFLDFATLANNWMACNALGGICN
jgi:hypothetical protein